MSYESVELLRGEEKKFPPFTEGVIGEKIAEGSHQTVYRLNGPESGFVVKVGEIHRYTPPVLKWLRWFFSRKKLSEFLEKSLGPEFKIMPDMEFIKKGLAEYRLIKKYFGCENEVAAKDATAQSGGADDRRENDPRESLSADLSNEQSPFYKEILRTFRHNSSRVRELTRIFKRHKRENFLKKERLVVARPPDVTETETERLQRAGEKLPYTYYEVISKPPKNPLFFERSREVPRGEAIVVLDKLEQ